MDDAKRPVNSSGDEIEAARPKVESTVDEGFKEERLDKHGLPLSPQPTDRKDDPLVRSLHRQACALRDAFFPLT